MAAPKHARQHAAETEEVLVVVFDGARARFFAREPNGRLTPKNEIESGLHHFVQDAVSDKPGRSFASAGQGRRSAIEPKHDKHKMEKHNFVHAIVKALDLAYDQGKFKHLAVVAPTRSIGEFRTLASDKLRRTVWREVSKELMDLSDHELQGRLVTELGPET
jgi:protein required for attachment to host cells